MDNADVSDQYDQSLINLVSRLEKQGITLEQLEKLAKGEAWVAEWKELSTMEGLITITNGDLALTFNGKTDVPTPEEGE